MVAGCHENQLIRRTLENKVHIQLGTTNGNGNSRRAVLTLFVSNPDPSVSSCGQLLFHCEHPLTICGDNPIINGEKITSVSLAVYTSACMSSDWSLALDKVICLLTFGFGIMQSGLYALLSTNCVFRSNALIHIVRFKFFWAYWDEELKSMGIDSLTTVGTLNANKNELDDNLKLTKNSTGKYTEESK